MFSFTEFSSFEIECHYTGHVFPRLSCKFDDYWHSSCTGVRLHVFTWTYFYICLLIAMEFTFKQSIFLSHIHRLSSTSTFWVQLQFALSPTHVRGHKRHLQCNSRGGDCTAPVSRTDESPTGGCSICATSPTKQGT